MIVESINLNFPLQKNEVKKFLKKFDLEYDEKIDTTFVIRKDDEIVGTASKYKNIIKCFAIDDSLRGEGVANTLITPLINKAFDENIFHLFVYTKPMNEIIFKGIGFKGISKTDKVALLEIGMNSIDKTINKIKSQLNWNDNSNNGILVMNCNPFTLGHLYLIENASKLMDNILVLVVQEDKSDFPFNDRITLVKAGTSHIKNVTVLPSSEYVISSATFPSYFLKKEDNTTLEFMKLDSTIVAEHFCKKLNISTRFLGEEPLCPLTDLYNKTILEIFKNFNINVNIIPRKKVDDEIISASLVRKLFKEGDMEKIKTLVPITTFNFLNSQEGRKIRENIISKNI